mgnify:CR=1 FL=1
MKLDLSELIDQVQENTSRRFTCPKCGVWNTFGITKANGQIFYQCFRSSCPLAGIEEYQRSAEDIRKAITGLRQLDVPLLEFTLPPYFIMGLANDKVQKYLVNNNCIESYKKGLFKIGFDPKENRAVFIIEDAKGEIRGAVGRVLAGGILPKSKNYHKDLSYPFFCGKGDHLVLVEDCASACAIGQYEDFTGVALLGTKILQGHLQYFKQYKVISVALDKDASRKSLDLIKQLRFYYNNIKVMFLEKDIKNMTEYELKLNFDIQG